MENGNKKGGFSYTYSADEQEEIRSIREKYVPKEEKESKLERVRRLDARATQRAQTVSLISGLLGALIFGLGMSLVTTDLGNSLGAVVSMILGVISGVVGGALMGIAYPIYNIIIKRERQRIAPEILRLTDELIK